MGKKNAISQYRERLDKTLSSAELTNTGMLKTLLKNQFLQYAEDDEEEICDNLLDKRTQEVSNFLDMLRSTSIDDHEVSKSRGAHGDWKLKHDNEEFRVMYREGLHGTPFHTLMVEGYVDGPLEVCLCVSWESALYNKWWPQSSFPSFKVTESTCLQKVRIGEQICLVRVKVAWPLSAREALVHFIFFEYFQDDLIVVLFNTISDVSSIDKATHGFTSDGIPEAKDVVRIDVVGGFALQKVTNQRSYFRTIATMDMKLDFVPPSLINFISRQLVGNGFRLYQKTVASVSNCDEDYSNALGDRLYSLTREALFSSNKSGEVLEGQELKSEAHILPSETLIQGIQDDMHDVERIIHDNETSIQGAEDDMHDKEQKVHANETIIQGTQDDTHDVEQKVHFNDHAGESPLKKAQDIKRKAFGEIEEEESEESTYLEDSVKAANQPSASTFADTNGVNAKKRISIRPEVEEALGTLEKAISIVRQYGFNAQSRSSSLSSEETAKLEEVAIEKSTYAAEDNVDSKMRVGLQAASKKFAENLEMTTDDSTASDHINDIRSAGSNSFSREVNHTKVVPASPQKNVSRPIETEQVALNSYENATIKANGLHENGVNDVKKLSNWRKHTFCCFGLYSG